MMICSFIINSLIFDVCKRIPSTYISKSQAVADAIKFNVINHAENLGGVSFLSIGSTLSAFHLSKSGDITQCKIQNLFIEDNLTAGKFAERCSSKDQLELLLTKSINFIDSAFNAGTLVIESDTSNIDSEMIRSIARTFAKAHLSLPILHAVCLDGNDAGISILSAAKRAESNFVKSLIVIDK